MIDELAEREEEINKKRNTKRKSKINIALRHEKGTSTYIRCTFGFVEIKNTLARV